MHAPELQYSVIGLQSPSPLHWVQALPSVLHTDFGIVLVQSTQLAPHLVSLLQVAQPELVQ
jgi:hypothetical protein